MEELPPCFTTSSLTLATAQRLVAAVPNRKGGYDAVNISSTRFNLVQRQLGLPHPVSYAHLVTHLVDNWHEYEGITRNKTSRIRPHRWKDGRLISMDAIGRSRPARVGSRYLIEADIASCYPSIYTHSLAWALVGQAQAKAQRNNYDAYFNQIDILTRKTRRNETNGLLIGPGTSAVAAELILSKIDANLRDAGYKFSRFIDDYRFHAKSAAEGERFTRDLAANLATMSLQMNHRKTKLVQLPAPGTPTWIRELTSKIPKSKNLRTSEALNLIDYAIELTGEFPDASALKYALTVIEKTVSSSKSSKLDHKMLVSTLCRLAFHRPVALPFLVRTILEKPQFFTDSVAQDLDHILREHASYNRTDAITWILFALIKTGRSPSAKAAAAVLASKDCMSLVLLSRSSEPQTRNDVQVFAQGLLTAPVENYELDRYWPLVYDLFKRNELASVGEMNVAFKILKEGGFDLVELASPDLRRPVGPRGRDPYALLA